MRLAVKRMSIALMVVTLLATAGCGKEESASSTSSSTESTAATTGVQPEEAIWPFANTDTRYTDPTEAALGFATEYLGFVNPVSEEFQPGDSRSGEVSIRPSATGPVTTVMVRQVDSSDTWWAIGATTANLQIESPNALATITSPVTVSGQSTASEGTINLEVREDGRLDPLAEGYTEGGSMGEMGPFSTSLPLAESGAEGGAIIVKTISAKDGNIAEASVIRIHFS